MATSFKRTIELELIVKQKLGQTPWLPILCRIKGKKAASSWLDSMKPTFLFGFPRTTGTPGEGPNPGSVHRNYTIGGFVFWDGLYWQNKMEYLSRCFPSSWTTADIWDHTKDFYFRYLEMQIADVFTCFLLADEAGDHSCTYSHVQSCAWVFDGFWEPKPTSDLEDSKKAFKFVGLTW